MTKDLLIISSRKELSNSDEIGPATFWNVTTDNQVMTDKKKIDIGDFKELIAGKKALLLVHGYNNEWEDVIRAYDIIDDHFQAQLLEHYDLIIGYTWPGGDGELEWRSAKNRSSTITPQFAMILRDYLKPLEALDIMTHSLGARVAMKALNMLPNNTARNLFQMASAVDNESIEIGNTYHLAPDQLTKNVVFHSRNDSVLRFFYTAAEWDLALGFSGPENPGGIDQNVHVVNCKHKVNAHGRYKYTPEVYEAINNLLTGAETNKFITL